MSGNYLYYFNQQNRQSLTQYLPGTAILLSLLWKVTSIYNFLPYIYLQLILDSILIACFFSLFKNHHPRIILATTLFMVFNFIVINKSVLIMGYDYWPNFCILINFVGFGYYLKKKNNQILLLTGLLTSMTIWFRSITTFFPFVMALAVIYYYKKENSLNIKNLRTITIYYLIPVIISISILSIYRLNQTGNARPTRSTFWHTFMSGVGQFSNPYGLIANDNAIREYFYTTHPNLKEYSYLELHDSPNSVYEKTLKEEAFNLIYNHPHLIIRNTFYRMAIMASPLLYNDWGAMPKGFKNISFPLGIVFLFLWFNGIIYIYKNDRILFILSLVVYIYFFALFSWFYIVARLIYTFLFIFLLIYLYGLKKLLIDVKRIE